MAFLNQQAFPIILVLLLISFATESLSRRYSDGEIIVYWGQNQYEGTLRSTCDSRRYRVVNIAYLNVFGSNQTAELNLARHCHSSSGSRSCRHLERDIRYCQRERRVKLFLSIGGPYGKYQLDSEDDAKSVAKYLNDNFLSRNEDGPLGRVALDGINFSIEQGSADHWEVLGSELRSLTANRTRRFYLSSSPTCDPLDYYQQVALRNNTFDDILVKFFGADELCQFSYTNTDNLLQSFGRWSKFQPNSTIYLGLPAGPSSESPDGTGFIPPPNLIAEVLPKIRRAHNYGGVALWDRGADVFSQYGAIIKPYVTRLDDYYDDGFYHLRSVTQTSNQ